MTGFKLLKTTQKKKREKKKKILLDSSLKCSALWLEM